MTFVHMRNIQYYCRYRVKNRLEVIKTRRTEKTKEGASASREGKMVPKLGLWQCGGRDQEMSETVAEII